VKTRDIGGIEDETEEDFTSGAFIDPKNCIYCKEDEEDIMREVFKDIKEDEGITHCIEEN